MLYTLKDISKAPATTILANVSKAELVAWMVRQDAWRTQLTMNRIDRIHGTDTMGSIPDEYVPTVFDRLAMNTNDKRSLTNLRYTVVHTKPFGPFPPDQVARQYMVLDEDGRVVDVRDWLDDGRQMLRHGVPEPTASPVKVKEDKTVYRKTTGFRQALSMPLQPDDDWHELVGNVPSRLTRKPRGSAMTGKRIRGVSRCWKDNPGRTRNWQRDTRGHMPAKVSLPINFDALNAELTSA